MNAVPAEALQIWGEVQVRIQGLLKENVLLLVLPKSGWGGAGGGAYFRRPCCACLISVFHQFYLDKGHLLLLEQKHGGSTNREIHQLL